MSLDYEITQNGRRVAAISRAFLTLGDRYALEVFDPQDALIGLCTVLAIDCCDEELFPRCARTPYCLRTG